MIAGDPTDWEKVFAKDLIPQVLSCISRAWPRITTPGASTLEEEISLRLYCELVGAKNRSKYPFRFQLESVEVDIAKVAEVGREDIVVFPGSTNREEIYFCMEAKRLNALSGGTVRSLAEEYVQEGMKRYVEGKYASGVQHGMMLGYVLDGKKTTAIKKVHDKVVADHAALGMATASGLGRSRYKSRGATLRETKHTRTTDSVDFWIHHTFLAPAKPKAKPKTKKAGKKQAKAKPKGKK
jgi:hypothetical protein